VSSRIALIPGDGIGPEVLEAAVEVTDVALACAGDTVEWQRFPWSAEYYLRHGRMMPDDGLEHLRAFDAILLGAVGDPRIPDHVTLHGLLLPIRRTFDQYLCVRPVRLYNGVTSPVRDLQAGGIDLVIFRENTEGEYADVGGRLYEGSDSEVAIQSNVFTRRGCRRIMEAAFAAARGRRRHVTSITKSNAQAYGMVLWDDVFREVARAWPDVATRSLLVDAAAVDLLRRPATFDVVVASNLFGDILSDLGAAVVGGLGLAPSANINPARTAPSMFEPVHGSAPDIAGRGTANPIAAVLAAAMMLEHIGSDAAAAVIRKAVEAVLRAGVVRTADLGGTSRTVDMSRAVIEALAS
jgi:tartrate dehydrogenase/decarboxylase / D-malate dehydrogenase